MHVCILTAQGQKDATAVRYIIEKSHVPHLVLTAVSDKKRRGVLTQRKRGLYGIV